MPKILEMNVRGTNSDVTIVRTFITLSMRCDSVDAYKSNKLDPSSRSANISTKRNHLLTNKNKHTCFDNVNDLDAAVVAKPERWRNFGPNQLRATSLDARKHFA
jgi:hypothetical protein